MSGIQSIVRDKAGNAIASTRITVHPAGSDGLAAIFEDTDLTVPKDNPFTSESNGFYSFYTNAGFYDIEYEKSGFPTVILEDVELAFGVNGGTITGNVTIDGNLTVTGTIVGQIDHGSLLGLADDDHLQYLIRSGIRPMTGDLDMGENNLIGTTRVTGPDTGGAARSGIELSEGIGPELRLDFNEANLGITPQILLSSDGINLDATIRAQGGGDLQFGDALDMNGFAINELLDAVLAQDAVTLSQLQAAVPGDASFSARPAFPTADIADGGAVLPLTNFVENNGGHSFNAGDLVIGVTGVYMVQASIKWEINAVGSRGIELSEGINQLGFAEVPAVSGRETGLVCQAVIRSYTAGDEISFFAFQDSGGALNPNQAQNHTVLNGFRLI